MSLPERISLTGLPHEDLAALFYPDNPLSPTLGQLQALVAIANGLVITQEVRVAVMGRAIRYQQTLEQSIDTWNKMVKEFPRYVEDSESRVFNFRVVGDAMAFSVGANRKTLPEIRRLINSAFKLLQMDISPN